MVDCMGYPLWGTLMSPFTCIGLPLRSSGVWIRLSSKRCASIMMRKFWRMQYFFSHSTSRCLVFTLALVLRFSYHACVSIRVYSSHRHFSPFIQLEKCTLSVKRNLISLLQSDAHRLKSTTSTLIIFGRRWAVVLLMKHIWKIKWLLLSKSRKIRWNRKFCKKLQKLLYEKLHKRPPNQNI